MPNKDEHTVRTAGLLAQRLCTAGLPAGLPAGPGGPFRFFTEVPLWCLGAQTVIDLEHPQAADWRSCVDLVICRGDTVVLAVELMLQQYPAKRLAGIERLELCESRELPRHKAVAAAERAFRLVAEKLRTLPPPDPAAARYLPAAVRAAPGGEAQRWTARMQRNHLLTGRGGITGFGRACGLFRETLRGPNGAVCRTVFYRGSEALLRQILEPPRSLPRPETAQTAPLAARLERLAQGEDSAGAPAEHLQALLRTPITALCGAGTERCRQLQSSMAEAMRLLGHSRAGISTYGGALWVVWQLRRRGAETGERALCAAEKELLRQLDLLLLDPAVHPAPRSHTPDAAAPRPLAERLGGAGSSRAACFFGPLPLKSYFAAAARRLHSKYPNWIYRQQFRSRMNLDKNREEKYTLFVMADAARMMLEEEYPHLFRADTETDAACFTYDLLVEPVFPDPPLHDMYCHSL